jgi:hypothetical protein
MIISSMKRTTINANPPPLKPDAPDTHFSPFLNGNAAFAPHVLNIKLKPRCSNNNQ